MNRMAFIFPGQGSQYPGMGRGLFRNYPESRLIFEEADEALHFPLSRTCFQGSEEDLKLTHITQPAILTLSVALIEILKKRISLPGLVAGHSLGEYSALVCAGSLSFSEAVETVKLRGEYMQEAVPIGKGTMAAIIGMKSEEVEALCQDASHGDVVSPANYNAPGQTVIAGETRAVERAMNLAKVKGAKKVLKLPVSAPFHCELMRPAQERLARHLETITISDLSIPLVTNVDAKIISRGEQVKEALTRQVSSPVQWEASVRVLKDHNVQTLIEVGPGKVLSGLAKRIDSSFRIHQTDGVKPLEQTLRELESINVR